MGIHWSHHGNNNWVYLDEHSKRIIEYSKRLPGKPVKKYAVMTKWKSVQQFNSLKKARSYIKKYRKDWDF